MARRLRRLDARAETSFRAWQARGARVGARPAAKQAQGRSPFRSAVLSVIGITWILNEALDVTVPWYVAVLATVVVYASLPVTSRRTR